MITHRFQGDTATKIFKFILPASKVVFMKVPDSWICPLTFVKNSYKLYQKEAGPCGLFAVLQAYMIMTSKFNNEFGPEEALYESILEIMLKLHRSYAFCTDFSLGSDEIAKSKNRFIELQITDSKEEALNFLKKTNYTSQKNTAILLVISFAFLAGPKLLSCYAYKETFITDVETTDVHFVYLLLTGQAIDIPCDGCTNVGGILCSGIKEQPSIGFLSVNEDIANENEEQSKEIGFHFKHPMIQSWVIHYSNHFTALSREENGKFYEYNNFTNSVASKELNSKHPLWKRLVEIAKHY